MLSLCKLMASPSILRKLSTQAPQLSALQYRNMRGFSPPCGPDLVEFINNCDPEVVTHPASGLTEIESSATRSLRRCPGFGQPKCIANNCDIKQATYDAIFSKAQRSVDTYQERADGNVNPFS